MELQFQQALHVLQVPKEASHVLLAMGRSRSEAKSSLRVSWGWSTTEDEIDYFLERLTHHIQRLQQKQSN
ncbi:MAG: hypothetical protein CM1200mP30_24720 [Pseudomonadota bacterium]|nr:MAG: hypothetical protein CM1200mP30_24720 [Pseudomonadota bacterium]